MVKPEKKTVLITGVGSGIGRQLVECFLENDYNVIGISRSIQSFIITNEALYNHLVFDWEDFNSLAERIDTLLEDSKIDFLINNAGLLKKQPAAELAKDDFAESFYINSIAPFLLVQSLKSSVLFVEKAHIVQISSMAGVQGALKFPGLLAYSASKAALIAITESLQSEWGDSLTFNTLALGAVETEMFKRAFFNASTPISDVQMAKWIFNFTVNSGEIMAGQVVKVKKLDP
ncbi:MAG: SDR family oxidoreductase [Salibacteraceae bacterium]|jgi:3-oxoacyl-[acyl-carrier protein] reductase|nr:SDR family oxidoreductase [Salibacteraceae bacterium]MDP4687967.1 SDR family oxidoreductase [Salibacteraceae bacterium]MDP4843722.1 SDR family oxidoreductase [Salibacteraceae bacterium]MDP4933603.1 SDR family oxidoreductase [Salibacteraceae bacterium]MDP4965865.1 SDR family oxidoreductase [Salibacteraceae bacterium]